MKKLHPVYGWFMLLMALMGLLGLTLLIYGSVTQPALPAWIRWDLFLGGYLHG